MGGAASWCVVADGAPRGSATALCGSSSAWGVAVRTMQSPDRRNCCRCGPRPVGGAKPLTPPTPQGDVATSDCPLVPGWPSPFRGRRRAEHSASPARGARRAGRATPVTPRSTRANHARTDHAARKSRSNRVTPRRTPRDHAHAGHAAPTTPAPVRPRSTHANHARTDHAARKSRSNRLTARAATGSRHPEHSASPARGARRAGRAMPITPRSSNHARADHTAQNATPTTPTPITPAPVSRAGPAPITPRGAPGHAPRSSRGRANAIFSLAVVTSCTSPQPRSSSHASRSITSSSGTDAPLVTPTVPTPSNQDSSTSWA